MRHHIGNGAADAHDIECREAEENVAHVRDGGVGDHVLDVALRECDIGRVDHIDRGENRNQRRPELRSERQDKEADADERVAADLFQHTRIDHRDCCRCACVSVWRPYMHREHREMRAEPDKQEEECRHLYLPRDMSRESSGGECLKVERPHPGLVRTHVEKEHADEHERRADEEENGHLHRRVFLRHALGRAPDHHHQIRGDDDHLTENEEEEEVAHEECSRDTRDHDEQEDEVLLDPLFHMP